MQSDRVRGETEVEVGQREKKEKEREIHMHTQVTSICWLTPHMATGPGLVQAKVRSLELQLGLPDAWQDPVRRPSSVAFLGVLTGRCNGRGAARI